MCKINFSLYLHRSGQYISLIKNENIIKKKIYIYIYVYIYNNNNNNNNENVNVPFLMIVQMINDV